MKILKLIGLLAVSGLLLAACNNATDNNNNNNTTPVRLIWWGSVHSEAVMRPLIDEYQTLNTNITIDYSTSRWNSQVPNEVAAAQYQQELDRTLTSDNLVSIPDIFTIDSTWLGRYERYLTAAPADVATVEQYKAAFHQAVVDNLIVKGTDNLERIYGLPDYIDVLGLVYNNDMLIADDPTLKIPTNWSEFKTLAQKLTVKGPNNKLNRAGFAGGYGENVEFAPELFNLLMFQNGVSVVDGQGLPVFATSDMGDAKATLDFYRSFARGNSVTWTPDKTVLRNDSGEFIEEDLASLIVPSWRYRQLIDVNEKNGIGIDMRVAKIPQLAGQEKEIYWASYFANVVSAQRPNNKEAWKFLAWLTQPDQLRKIHNNVKQQSGYFGTLYPRKDMQSELVDDQYLKIYNEMLPNAISWKMVDGLRVDNIFETLLNGNGREEDISGAEGQIKVLINQKSELLNSTQ